MILLVNSRKQTWLPFCHLLVSSGLWLVHHPLCRLFLHGSLLWYFFSPGICLQFPLFLPQLTCLGWIHVQIHVFLEIIHPTACKISPSGGPHLCFKSTKPQMSPPAHLPTSPSAHQHQISLLYFCPLDWRRGRLHFLLSHNKVHSLEWEPPDFSNCSYPVLSISPSSDLLNPSLPVLPLCSLLGLSTHMDCCKNHQTGLIFPPSRIPWGPSLLRYVGPFMISPYWLPSPSLMPPIAPCICTCYFYCLSCRLISLWSSFPNLGCLVTREPCEGKDETRPHQPAPISLSWGS